MQRPPLFESDSFIYLKNIFETYVKSKYLDLWHVITNGDFQPIQQNPETKLDEVIPFEKQSNNQVKDNKIDLLVQQYEQFVISEDESIDSTFARFNTIITSLKALDEWYSSKNYVRKFLRALHPKWRAKVMTIKESKDLISLQAKGERKSLALKAKKESSDEECLTSESKDEEYAMVVEDFKKFFKRRERPKPSKDKNQRAFVGGSWSDSGEEDDEKAKDETCLVAQASNKVCSDSSYFSDENSSIDDLALDNEYDKLCKMSLKIITKNKRLKAVRNSLENELSKLKEKLSTFEKNKGVDLECTKCQLLRIENEKLKEEAIKLTKFEKSTHCLNKMLSNQKPSGDKLGLGFNSLEASTSGTKEIKFVKSQKETSPGGGPLNKGGPQSNYGTAGLFTRYLGPSAVRSYGENLYTLVIVDHYSRFLRVFGSKCFILNTKDYLTKFDPKSYECVFLGYSQNSKAYIILNKHTRKIEESLNVTFDETPPPSKTSPLVDDDLDKEEAIKVSEKKILENDIEDETLEIDEVVNIKESRNHPLENVIGNLNQRALRSQADS
ncbi:hypothetical protein Tco_1048558 [Tanacetum coccineum]